MPEIAAPYVRDPGHSDPVAVLDRRREGAP
jgi:hypothetical protein